jgi:hypothetical protein
MFEIPEYKGCNPEYVESSLNFFNYHANRTMSGKDRTSALEKVRAKAAEWKIKLKEQEEAS